MFRAAEGNYELIIVSLGLENFDGLRLCSQLRSLDRTRNVPILAIAEADDNARLMRGLEIGINDYLMRPIDKNELLARVRTQIRKKRYTERLRDNVQMSIEMAITDGLTGLHNRRYMESHLGKLVEQAAARGKPLAVLVLDIDYFKSINDTYGHDAGDDVLREFAIRMRKSIRGIDLACRYRRRGIRGGDAGNRHGGGGDGRRAAAPARSRPSRSRSSRAASRSRSRSRSASRRWRLPHDTAAQAPQARRPGALSRQARRPKPRGRGRGLINSVPAYRQRAPRGNLILYVDGRLPSQPGASPLISVAGERLASHWDERRPYGRKTGQSRRRPRSS